MSIYEDLYSLIVEYRCNMEKFLNELSKDISKTFGSEKVYIPKESFSCENGYVTAYIRLVYDGNMENDAIEYIIYINVSHYNDESIKIVLQDKETNYGTCFIFLDDRKESSINIFINKVVEIYKEMITG